ncbi:alpha/beta hydrolase [Yoonia sp. F2084L]|uniref:alpha/beta fold hydrolase n=1 Tax=Yoonia sp. F2084L TaxID=2926419 RepID=UPI001FF567B0|nr:alpha/beta hydrolase [Yoonia sp. F2084L]MCK0095484.1 alpha/beta hydrolase [Yoonia sp. F2084L]
MAWSLPDAVMTSAGPVAAGSAGTGPPLVLAHGWPWSSFSWHRLIPTLAQTRTVHWYDMPGYGRSGMDPDQPTGLDVQGAVFAEMLAHWGLERPAVLAHDFGGAVTLRAHLLHGCDYARLLLMNVVAVRPWGSDFFDHVGRHVDAFMGLPPHIHKGLVTAYIKGALAHDIAASDLDALIAPWLTEAEAGSFYRQFAQADERFTAEIEPLFSDIRCPTQIIWGADDPWIPLARGQTLHDMIPHAGFTTLSGLGHLPQLEGPAQVLEAVQTFLHSDHEQDKQ